METLRFTWRPRTSYALSHPMRSSLRVSCLLFPSTAFSYTHRHTPNIIRDFTPFLSIEPATVDKSKCLSDLVPHLEFKPQTRHSDSAYVTVHTVHVGCLWGSLSRVRCFQLELLRSYHTTGNAYPTRTPYRDTWRTLGSPGLNNSLSYQWYQWLWSIRGRADGDVWSRWAEGITTQQLVYQLTRSNQCRS